MPSLKAKSIAKSIGVFPSQHLKLDINNNKSAPYKIILPSDSEKSNKDSTNKSKFDTNLTNPKFKLETNPNLTKIDMIDMKDFKDIKLNEEEMNGVYNNNHNNNNNFNVNNTNNMNTNALNFTSAVNLVKLSPNRSNDVPISINLSHIKKSPNKSDNDDEPLSFRKMIKRSPNKKDDEPISILSTLKKSPNKGQIPVKSPNKFQSHGTGQGHFLGSGPSNMKSPNKGQGQMKSPNKGQTKLKQNSENTFKNNLKIKLNNIENSEKEDELNLRRNYSARNHLENKILGSYTNRKELRKYFITPVVVESRDSTPDILPKNNKNNGSGHGYSNDFTLTDPEKTKITHINVKQFITK